MEKKERYKVIRNVVDDYKYEQNKMLLFKRCLTDDDYKEFVRIGKELQSEKYGLLDRLSKCYSILCNKDNELHSKGSDAYLVLGENGYELPKDIDEQNPKTIAEEERMLNNIDVQSLFKNHQKYAEYYARNWNVKPSIKHNLEKFEAFVMTAQIYGFMLGVPTKGVFDDNDLESAELLYNNEENDNKFVQELLSYYDNNKKYIDRNYGYVVEDKNDELYNTIHEYDIEDAKDEEKWQKDMYRILFGEKTTDENDKVNKIGTM